VGRADRHYHVIHQENWERGRVHALRPEGGEQLIGQQLLEVEDVDYINLLRLLVLIGVQWSLAMARTDTAEKQDSDEYKGDAPFTSRS
jgi:hypothetical protein